MLHIANGGRVPNFKLRGVQIAICTPNCQIIGTARKQL
jgi:hypothetical protein